MAPWYLRYSVLVTFRTVFWSIFGRGDTDVLSLGEYQNNFTEDIGYIIYGVFNIVTVTVLINMFIAVMTRSFQNIAVRNLQESSYHTILYFFELNTVVILLVVRGYRSFKTPKRQRISLKLLSKNKLDSYLFND